MRNYLTELLFIRNSNLISFFLLLIGLKGYHFSFGQCSVTASLSGSSFSNVTGISSYNWSSVTNAALSDNQRAGNGVFLGILSSVNTNWLVVKNFGFAIPSTASICGIEVTIERRATGLLIGSSIKDNSIRLVKNNIISGSDLKSSANWPGSDGNHVYGSSSETWGETWTPSDINATDFGIAISAKLSSGLASLFLTAEVDHVSIRVFYNIALPVQLLDFRAIVQRDKINLQWTTASESNSRHFIVERSTNRTGEWLPIDSINAAGNSTSIKQYHFSDFDFLPHCFYRLRLVDSDGHYQFSKIIFVDSYKESIELLTYPNPVKNEVNAIFPGKANKILLKNLSGVSIPLKNILTIDQGIKVRFSELQKGYYWLIIQTAERLYSKKILAL